MSKRCIWLSFLTAYLVVVLFFTGSLLFERHRYRALEGRVSPKKVEWEIVDKAADRFLFLARYSFVVEGKTYEGETLFSEDFFRNRWGAEQRLPAFAQKERKVWYQPGNPIHNTMVKQFPYKVIFSTTVLWIIFFYLLWLQNYVKSRLRG